MANEIETLTSLIKDNAERWVNCTNPQLANRLFRIDEHLNLARLEFERIGTPQEDEENEADYIQQMADRFGGK